MRSHDDDNNEVISSSGGSNGGTGGPPQMIMKMSMIVNQTVKMTTMIKYLETQKVESKDPEDLGLVVDL